MDVAFPSGYGSCYLNAGSCALDGLARDVSTVIYPGGKWKENREQTHELIGKIQVNLTKTEYSLVYQSGRKKGEGHHSQHGVLRIACCFCFSFSWDFNRFAQTSSKQVVTRAAYLAIHQTTASRWFTRASHEIT